MAEDANTPSRNRLATQLSPSTYPHLQNLSTGYEFLSAEQFSRPIKPAWEAYTASLDDRSEPGYDYLDISALDSKYTLQTGVNDDEV